VRELVRPIGRTGEQTNEAEALAVATDSCYVALVVTPPAVRLLTDQELSAWVVEAARDLVEVAAITGSQAPVPACPGWTMRQLVGHVISGLCGWYTYNITHGAEPLDYAASWNSQPRLPTANADRLMYLRQAADDFAALIAATDLDAPCYVFQDRRTARAWLRRAATETAVHLRDAQEVLGVVEDWTPERAASSIDETLRVLWHGALLLKGYTATDHVPDEPISVTATDLGITWRVTKAPDEFAVDVIDAAESLTRLSVSAASCDLIGWFWNRTPTSQLTVTGELELIEAWNLSAFI
jgi:uncharacterized protein (TIGR03083 family)